MTFLAHWKVNEGIGRGPTTAYDSAGGGSGFHHGTYVYYSTLYGDVRNGGPYGYHVRTYGLLGPGGLIQSIANPADFRLLGTVTVCAWVHLTDSSTTNRFVANCSGTDETQAQNTLWEFQVKTRRSLRFYWENGAGVDVIVDSTSDIMPVNGWCHVAAVRYEVTAGKWGVKFYVDGVLKSTNDNSGAGYSPPDGGGSSLPMCGRNGQGWNGNEFGWASVRVYDTAEGDASILAIYNAEKDWLDDTGTFDVDRFTSIRIDDIPGDPYSTSEQPFPTLGFNNIPGDPYSTSEQPFPTLGFNNIPGVPYSTLEQGQYGMHDNQGFFRQTIHYSHWGLPNTAPYCYDQLPTGSFEQPEVAISFSLGDDRGNVDENSIYVQLVIYPYMTDLVIHVDVIVDGIFQSPYSGSITANAENGFDVLIDGHPDFGDGLYIVNIYCEDDEDLPGNFSHSFSVFVKPQLLSVVPVSRRFIEFTFDLPIRIRAKSVRLEVPPDRYTPIDWTSKPDALALDGANPENFAFERCSSGSLVGPGEAVPIEAVYSEENVDVADTEGSIIYSEKIRVQTDYEQTSRASYKVTVSNLISGVAPMDPVTFEFAGYVISQVPRQSLILYETMPNVVRRLDSQATGELEYFFTAIQELFDRLTEDVDAFFYELCEIDRARPEFLDTILYDLGNPFADKLNLTTIKKRKLIVTLVRMYRQKGTCKGILNAVRFFVGVVLTSCSNAWAGTWRLSGGSYPSPIPGTGGPYRLNDNAQLGPGTLEQINSFWLYSPIALTADQRLNINTIVDYMKPAGTTFLGIVEP